ncbi:acyl-homoserine-lactone synthase [Psychromarinibacter halotolerans]|uniref:Acyl-homoserine-lactone synthase n=1 Tax=Psychromarinibacter halotolerans TaxID=1775175 RepID=A0ABV7GWT9_9RHOB|nr:acyl-homoserine-lactone synthase [Psychromarinibacter halotolerans]MDF0594676.1 acyl-homoserine-lactone synthase [Psychromarinibacter halotolerans]
MRHITFDLSTMHEHGSAFFDYLGLRKRFFVDILKWDIPHNDKFEMDQYDNPTAWYSLCIHEGEVIGGTRVMPTTARWGKHSYMLKDAREGVLDSIPHDAMPSDIISPYVWEMTRLVISPDLRRAEDRARCLQHVGQGLYDIAEAQNVSEYMGISAVALIRVLRQLGFPLERMGTPYHDAADRRNYTVMRMPVHLQNQRLLAAE